MRQCSAADVKNRSTSLRHRPLGTALRGSKPAAAVRTAPRQPARREQPTFSETMAREAVTRLAQDSVRVPPSRSAPTVASRAAAAFVFEEDAGWVRGHRRDAGAVVLARVRATPQATLDLHRLTRAVARRRLAAFLAEEAQRGKSSVLVVVGQGHHSQGGEGVLRREIAVWLTSGACARHVLAFQTAPRALGGSGAVVVVLGKPTFGP